jgi:tRNA pseudouridine55 synthase
MDGVLVIDKPSGPTSHDVVAGVRRALALTRVGHTGTLDPLATGVLPLVLGRATRLSRFLTASEKTYEAAIRLGVATDTADALGTPLGDASTGPWPSAHDVDRALDAFRGRFFQQPPAFSAKKIDGERSHRLARSGRAPLARPEPVEVTAFAIELVSVDGGTVVLRLRCSAGFYVRSLAHALGERLGIRGHLVALRRVASGIFTLAQALPPSVLDEPGGADRARDAVIALDALLPDNPAVVLTDEGVRRVRHGRDLGRESIATGYPPDIAATGAAHDGEARVRLLDRDGQLLGLAVRRGGAEVLHPAVVLV